MVQRATDCQNGKKACGIIEDKFAQNVERLLVRLGLGTFTLLDHTITVCQRIQ